MGVVNGMPLFVSHGRILLEGPSAIPFTQWTHLAVSFDGATKCLYVNGVQVASQGGLGALDLVYDPAVPVTIGSDWAFNASNSRFTGRVDEVAIYNRALAANEVYDIYNADFLGKDVTRPYFTSLCPLPDVAPGARYSTQLTTVLGKALIRFSLDAGTLPAGVTLSSAGLVSGVSAISGTYDFTVLATDADGKSAEQLYVLRVLEPVALPADMLCWWPGEPVTGSSAAPDIIGSHGGGFFRGKLAAPASYTADGKVGSAFAFDGTVYIQVPDATELRPAEMTAEAWVFPTVLNDDQQTVIARGSPTNADDAWWMGLFNGTPRFRSKHLGSGMLYLDAPSAIPLNEWTHLAISFDGTTKRLYVNGAQVESQGGLSAVIYEAAAPVTIGSDWASNATSQRFNGRVDEVSLYRRGLSSDEIFSIADAGSAGKRTTGPYINSSSRLPFAIVGQAYSHTFTSIRGTATVTYALSTSSALPPGLTLDSTGVLSGTPKSAGRFAFVVRATDAAGLFAEQRCATQAFESVPIPAGAVGWWRAESDARRFGWRESWSVAQ